MSEELFDKPISLYEFLNLPDEEQHRIAEKARQLTGIYTVDLARAWQLPAKELEKFSRKMPNNGFLYVQIDDVWKRVLQRVKVLVTNSSKTFAKLMPLFT